jgi:hypothetical protein
MRPTVNGGPIGMNTRLSPLISIFSGSIIKKKE